MKIAWEQLVLAVSWMLPGFFTLAQNRRCMSHRDRELNLQYTALRGYCTSGPYFWKLCAFSQKIKHDIERTGPVPGPSATNLWEFHFIYYAAATKNGCLLSSFLLFFGVHYFISIKIVPRTEKSYLHREKTTPFPTRPIFLTPDWTDPRFKQNIAPWPESGRGCTVRSGNPRRSGMPRSSLPCIIPSPLVWMFSWYSIYRNMETNFVYIF